MVLLVLLVRLPLLFSLMRKETDAVMLKWRRVRRVHLCVCLGMFNETTKECGEGRFCSVGIFAAARVSPVWGLVLALSPLALRGEIVGGGREQVHSVTA